MKNRKKIVLPNKSVIERPESFLDKALSNKPVKKQNFSSVSVQQNLDFYLQNILFPKPLHPSGDADSYFKSTLRNYEQLDFSLLRTSRTPASIKPTKSLDILKKKKSVLSSLNSTRKPKTLSTHLRPISKKRSSAPRLNIFKELPSENIKGTEEPEVEVFYSPESQQLNSSSQTLKNQSSKSSLTEVAEKFLTFAETEPATFEGTDQNITDNTSKEEPVSKQDRSKLDNTKESKSQKKVGKMGESGEEFNDEYETDVDDEEDGLMEVGKIIQEANDELAEVNEENTKITTDVDEGEEGQVQKSAAGGDGSVFKFDPEIDAAVLKELEEAEKQAKATAQIIYELKARVTELLKKEKHTEAEARELEEKNRELKAQMLLFEEKTKRIQFLIAQTNLFDKMIPPKTPLQVSHKEDMLPKVIVCGMTENNIPKLILCDDKKRKSCPEECNKEVNIPKSVVPKFAKRLSDSYTMQEKLAAENANLEGTRYQLQSDLLNKDQTIEYLQRKLCSIQCEMRMICKDNAVLNEKMAQMTCTPPKQEMKLKKGPCGKGKGPCPADIENRLNEYSQTTRLLEQQLLDMENDVKTMQTELSAVQAEREHLEQHKKVIICPPLCVPHPCPPCTPSPCTPVFTSPSCDQQLNEMREKYARLQDDFKGKVTEVGGLRADNEKLKAIAKDAEEARKTLEEKVKELERALRTLKSAAGSLAGSKEQIIEQEQQLTVAKQRFREAQDELEELRALIQEQQTQMDDYRNKYLEAQQEVEEQKRHIDMLEMDANRVSEQVNLEIQRVKAQFQEKLQELLPLPDLLKTTQLKLQETQEMHLLAERNNEALNRDLQIYKEQIAKLTDDLDMLRGGKNLGEDAQAAMAVRLGELERKVEELQTENDILRNNLDSTEALLDDTKLELDTKLHEIAQLSAQVESVREESARQVARNKERCETVRRSMQNQIFDLERQLAQSRACARAAQKDRDEIRQKMQAQINNLHENFEDAQMRIRNLQGHVNFLKETVPANDDFELKSITGDACNCG